MKKQNVFENEHTEGCLHCGRPEKEYKPARNIQFLCGGCLVFFLEMPQEDIASEYVDLVMAYEDTKNEIYAKRLRVLDLFRIPEVIEHEQVRPKLESLSDRKRNPGVFRVKQRPVRRIKEKPRVAVCKDKQNPKVVFRKGFN